MSEEAYASMVHALSAVGLTAQRHGPDQLIVSTQEGPVWPNRGNSFWLSFQGGRWLLSTWLPACYRIPPGQDVVALCSACMQSGTAMYKVPEEIARRFALERISNDEFDRLFPEHDDER